MDTDNLFCNGECQKNLPSSAFKPGTTVIEINRRCIECQDKQNKKTKTAAPNEVTPEQTEETQDNTSPTDPPMEKPTIYLELQIDNQLLLSSEDKRNILNVHSSNNIPGVRDLTNIVSPFVIGRSSSSWNNPTSLHTQLKLPDLPAFTLISGNHAVIKKIEDGTYTIEKQSQNQECRINDTVLSKGNILKLKNGDVIKVGTREGMRLPVHIVFYNQLEKPTSQDKIPTDIMERHLESQESEEAISCFILPTSQSTVGEIQPVELSIMEPTHSPIATQKPSLPIADRQIDIRRVQFLSDNLLGLGSFGKVYGGILDSSVPIAIKFMFQPLTTEDEKKKFGNEVSIHWHERTPFFVPLYGFGFDNNSIPFMVMKKMKCSLSHLIHQSSEWARLSMVDKIKHLSYVAQGICSLHERAHPVLHRDLKPGNILVTNGGKWKLADFGLSQVREMSKSLEISNLSDGFVIGSYAYMAPEVLRAEKYTKRADVYSFGIIMWEVFSCELPWRHAVDSEVLRLNVLEGRRLPLQDNWPHEIRSLIEKCWAPNVESRPYFHFIYDELVTFAGALSNV